MLGSDKYELLQCLSVGRTATLHLARQVGVDGFEKVVVIKRPLPELAEDELTQRTFLNEARIAAQLAHPNVVQIYELGEDDQGYFIAMEYVAGHDLDSITRAAEAKGKPIPHGLAAHIIALVCRGLHHAHTALTAEGTPLGLVHRDVCPRNIRLTFGGDVKLVDFGIATSTRWGTGTATGILRANFAYMSPEQCRGEPLDGRSDLFSAGAVLYELVCRRRLFWRGGELKTMQALLLEPIAPPSAVSDEVTDDLEQVIMRALARDRGQRYATSQEMQLELEAVIRENSWGVGPRSIAAYLRALDPSERTDVAHWLSGPPVSGSRRQSADYPHLTEGDDIVTRTVSSRAYVVASNEDEEEVSDVGTGEDATVVDPPRFTGEDDEESK